jgi:hypothetical protein
MMDKIMNKLIVFCFAMIMVSSCGTLKSPYYSDDALDWKKNNQPIQNKHIHSLYLIGDGGELDDKVQNKNFVLDAASEMLKEETVETSLVYLGDNVYPVGLQKSDDTDRDMGERILDAHLALSESHDGITYFIPGNHDWNKDRKGGRKAIKRQEDYIKEYAKTNGNVKFYPSNACGDPQVIKVNKDLVYVFLDSQWWLQNWSREKTSTVK